MLGFLFAEGDNETSRLSSAVRAVERWLSYAAKPDKRGAVEVAGNTCPDFFSLVDAIDMNIDEAAHSETGGTQQAFMRRLHDAGVPVGVGIAPIIPGLNDMQIPRILERARQCGARHAFMTLLRLSGQTLPVFDERLEQAFPQRARKVRNAILELRGGTMNDSRFGARHVGTGARWKAIEQLFETHMKRLGYEGGRRSESGPSTFRRPRGQLELF